MIQTPSANGDYAPARDIICGNTLFHDGDEYYVANITSDSVILTDAETQSRTLRLSLNEMSRIHVDTRF